MIRNFIFDLGNVLFRFDGEEYYIRKSMAEYLDGCIRPLSDKGVIVNLILLHAPVWRREVSGRFWRKISHPTYEEEGAVSLFDVLTEEGCRYYRAFVAFLARRYADVQTPYGRIAGLIIGNEVNSQWIWANAGDVPFGDYAAQYTSALRIAWQTASAVCRHIRVYASLDHFWAGKRDPASPTRFYSGRDLLAAVAHCCELEGNFCLIAAMLHRHNVVGLGHQSWDKGKTLIIRCLFFILSSFYFLDRGHKGKSHAAKGGTALARPLSHNEEPLAVGIGDLVGELRQDILDRNGQRRHDKHHSDKGNHAAIALDIHTDDKDRTAKRAECADERLRLVILGLRFDKKGRYHQGRSFAESLYSSNSE